jgi:F0F1-type ATP synthase assembly protein I
VALPGWLGFRANFADKNAAADRDEGHKMILVLIQILITVVIGAILFWLIDRFIRDRRLANLLKILVVLVCLASILQRLLPMLGVGF